MHLGNQRAHRGHSENKFKFIIKFITLEIDLLPLHDLLHVLNLLNVANNLVFATLGGHRHSAFEFYHGIWLLRGGGSPT